MSKRAVFYLIICLTFIMTSCTLPIGNNPPILEKMEDHQVMVNQTLHFPIVAKDWDGDILQLDVYPERFQAYVSENWEFSWTPGVGDIGQHTVTFFVSDGQAETTDTIAITVSAIMNHSPEIKAMEAQSIKEGELVRFMVAASDQDGDTLEFAATGALALYFDPATRVFHWQTVEGDAGEYQITFMVSDGQELVSMVVDITVVSNTNVAPEIVPQEDLVVNEGETIGPIALEASDANDDTLTWELIKGPGEIINQSYIWVTGYQDSGEHQVILRVSDGRGGVDLCTFWIRVTNVNREPVLQIRQANGTPVVNTIVFPLHQNMEIYLEATDPDGDSITYSLEDWYTNSGNKLLNLATHFTVDEESLRGVFSWAPIEGDEGLYSLTFKVSDANGGSDLESVVIQVPAI